jgi:hypothetical protein
MRVGVAAVGSVSAACLLLAACGDSKSSSGATGGGSTTGGSAGAVGLTGGASGRGGGGSHAGSSSGGASAGGSGGSSQAGADTGGTGVCAHELANKACWESYDVGPLASLQYNYYGGIFDGRYIVFPNAAGGIPNRHARFDTHGAFTSGWQGFDTSGTVNTTVRGGVFDGRFVYLTPTAPEHNGAAALTYDAVALRYDTQAEFSASAAWASFNLTQASGTADLTVPGFQGAAFDKRYVYFAPGYIGQLAGGTIASGNVSRYDTQADFEEPASWSSFDLVALDADAAGFSGLVFDGTYLYFVPHKTANPRAVRFDTRASFDMASSWSVFDLSTVDEYAGGFTGGVFDGRYVYFVPASGSDFNHRDSVVTRYDTQGAFTAATAWSSFNTKDISGNNAWTFTGGAFDGRYLYLVPSNGSPFLRYDTEAGFDAAGSWENLFLNRVSANASRYSGASFDGRYVYLSPGGFGPVLRFDARDAAPVPKGYEGGSFY